MALVVLPEGQQRSGSIGGTVWSRNRYGAYIRNRSVPVNPATDRQVAVRNIVRALTIAWQNTLTPTQRNAWDVYASNVTWQNKLGQSVNLTGLNHYIRSNTPRLQSGSTQIDGAPNIFNLATAELALTGAAAESTQLGSFGFDDTAAWANEDDGHQYVYGGLPQNGGIKFFGGPWRLIDVIDGDAITPPVSPITPTYPFPFAEGQRLWIRTRVSRADGRLSEFAQVNFLAGP